MKAKNKKKRLEARIDEWDKLRATPEKDKKGGLIKKLSSNDSAFKKPGSLK